MGDFFIQDIMNNGRVLYEANQAFQDCAVIRQTIRQYLSL